MSLVSCVLKALTETAEDGQAPWEGDSKADTVPPACPDGPKNTGVRLGQQGSGLKLGPHWRRVCALSRTRNMAACQPHVLGLQVLVGVTLWLCPHTAAPEQAERPRNPPASAHLLWGDQLPHAPRPQCCPSLQGKPWPSGTPYLGTYSGPPPKGDRKEMAPRGLCGAVGSPRSHPCLALN